MGFFLPQIQCTCSINIQMVIIAELLHQKVFIVHNKKSKAFSSIQNEYIQGDL